MCHLHWPFGERRHCQTRTATLTFSHARSSHLLFVSQNLASFNSFKPCLTTAPFLPLFPPSYRLKHTAWLQTLKLCHDSEPLKQLPSDEGPHGGSLARRGPCGVELRLWTLGRQPQATSITWRMVVLKTTNDARELSD